MDTNEKLRSFMEEIRSITPPYGDLMNNGIPAAAQVNTAAERTQELHRVAGSFARAYQTKTWTAEEVKAQSDELEGLLLALTTFGVLTGERADKLADDLHELIDNREV